MDWKSEWKPLTLVVAVFLILFFLPVGTGRFDQAMLEAKRNGKNRIYLVGRPI